MRSLPEVRALAGKADGAGTDPVQIAPDAPDLQRFADEAERVLRTGGRFRDTDLHQIIARLLLEG